MDSELIDLTPLEELEITIFNSKIIIPKTSYIIGLSLRNASLGNTCISDISHIKYSIDCSNIISLNILDNGKHVIKLKKDTLMCAHFSCFKTSIRYIKFKLPKDSEFYFE